MSEIGLTEEAEVAARRSPTLSARRSHPAQSGETFDALFNAPADKQSGETFDALFNALVDKQSDETFDTSFDALADKQSGETFDGPPTLERSGSEHRRAVTSPLPEVSVPRERGNRRGCKDH